VDRDGKMQTIETYRQGLAKGAADIEKARPGRETEYRTVKQYDDMGTVVGENIQAFSSDKEGNVKKEKIGGEAGGTRVVEVDGAPMLQRKSPSGEWVTIQALTPEQIEQLSKTGRL